MSWPRQGSQNPLDNRECKWKTWISWVWGFEVVHAVKGSFEVALPPNASLPTRGEGWPSVLRAYKTPIFAKGQKLTHSPAHEEKHVGQETPLHYTH